MGVEGKDYFFPPPPNLYSYSCLCKTRSVSYFKLVVRQEGWRKCWFKICSEAAWLWPRPAMLGSQSRIYLQSSPPCSTASSWTCILHHQVAAHRMALAADPRGTAVMHIAYLRDRNKAIKTNRYVCVCGCSSFYFSHAHVTVSHDPETHNISLWWACSVFSKITSVQQADESEKDQDHPPFNLWKLSALLSPLCCPSLQWTSSLLLSFILV